VKNPDLAGLDNLKTRIQGLRAKTTDNGCTEAEALLAAAKVAELLDRYDLSLTDVEFRDAPCERREYETHRKKRTPLDDCIGAIANFCDCRGIGMGVWDAILVGEIRARGADVYANRSRVDSCPISSPVLWAESVSTILVSIRFCSASRNIWPVAGIQTYSGWLMLLN
jgi:Protein of unknown function (DUF2786)